MRFIIKTLRGMWWELWAKEQTFYLPVTMNAENLATLQDAMMAVHRKRPKTPIILNCDSYGGNLEAVLSFVQFWSKTNIRLVTIVRQGTGSGGVLLFSLGDRRIIREGAMLHTHAPQHEKDAGPDERLAPEDYDKLCVTLMEMQSAVNGKKLSMEIYPKDDYYDIDTGMAVEMGFADIVSTREPLLDAIQELAEGRVVQRLKWQQKLTAD